eukprot:gene47504-27124_t
MWEDGGIGWVRGGQCLRGDACIFVHEPGETQPLHEDRKRDSMSGRECESWKYHKLLHILSWIIWSNLWYWQTCPCGERCPYRHSLHGVDMLARMAKAEKEQRVREAASAATTERELRQQLGAREVREQLQAAVDEREQRDKARDDAVSAAQAELRTARERQG